MSKDFDQLIKDGEVVKAAYLFAEEGYENGDFGFTRKQLIEGLAERVQELETRIDKFYKLNMQLHRKNKRYREAIKKVRYAMHTQISSINHQENTKLEREYIKGILFASKMVDRYFSKALEGE